MKCTCESCLQSRGWKVSKGLCLAHGCVMWRGTGAPLCSAHRDAASPSPVPQPVLNVRIGYHVVDVLGAAVVAESGKGRRWRYATVEPIAYQRVCAAVGAPLGSPSITLNTACGQLVVTSDARARVGWAELTKNPPSNAVPAAASMPSLDGVQRNFVLESRPRMMVKATTEWHAMPKAASTLRGQSFHEAVIDEAADFQDRPPSPVRTDRDQLKDTIVDVLRLRERNEVLEAQKELLVHRLNEVLRQAPPPVTPSPTPVVLVESGRSELAKVPGVGPRHRVRYNTALLYCQGEED